MAYDQVGNVAEATLRGHGAALERIIGELGRRIVGQKALVERLVMALIAEGHVLLEVQISGETSTMAKQTRRRKEQRIPRG